MGDLLLLSLFWLSSPQGICFGFAFAFASAVILSAAKNPEALNQPLFLDLSSQKPLAESSKPNARNR
jgi:hypothetical protein